MKDRPAAEDSISPMERQVKSLTNESEARGLIWICTRDSVPRALANPPEHDHAAAIFAAGKIVEALVDLVK